MQSGNDSANGSAAVRVLGEDRVRKLEELKRKRLKVEQNSSTKYVRKQNIKELKSELLRNVKDEFSEGDKKILQKVMEEEKDRRLEEKRIAKEKQELEMKKQKPIESYVIKYRSMKERLSEVSHGRASPKSVLESSIDKAIQLGHYTLAEEISDEISKQNQENEVKEALELKRHMQAQEESSSKRKKPKLRWGFETKERWESKGNM